MNTYLEAFFKDFEYDPADAAHLTEAYSRIVSDERAAECFAQAMAEYDGQPCDHVRILSLADEAALVTEIHEYTAELLFYICLSKALKERYRSRGIDEAIFHNSMLDLRYKLEECKAVKGVIGSFVAPWFEGFFEMTRFALGRLQFEIIPFGEAYEHGDRHLTPDSKVINVHIPRTCTPLDETSCEQAYAQAAAFFAQELAGEIAFTCNSWLLYPENETILSPQSNIVKFMKRYDIVRQGINVHKTDLWRLFDTEESHPDRLPTDTTARRLYAEHIRAGGKLGWGIGVFFW